MRNKNLIMLLAAVAVIAFAAIAIAGQIAVGTTTGTGAAINISCGFKPAYVRVVNVTSPGAMTWNSSMPATSALKTITAGTVSYITSPSGISQYSGSAGSAGKGFTIGTDSVINQNGHTLYWEASQ